MAGPLDILRSMAGKHGAARAPEIQLPGFDRAQAQNLRKIKDELAGMQSVMGDLYRSRAHESLGKLAEKARKLTPLKKAIKDLAEAQGEFNVVMSRGTSTIEQQVKAYDKLAKTKQKATREINEQTGAFGRLKNVADDVFSEANVKAGVLAGLLKLVTQYIGRVNTGFELLARTGMAGDKTFGQLAATTGMFVLEMELASLNVARFGVSAKDSNAAFIKLTETYGGTAKTVDMLGEKWAGVGIIARMSGLGMVEVANLAQQGMTRLGESLDTTLDNVVHLTRATGEMNKRWGDGAVNTREFSKAVQSLAYSQNFFNQSTRMTIDTLEREVQTQLALGRSRTAAITKAQENLEIAGKVNIIGAIQLRDDVQRAYEAAKLQGKGREYLAKITKDFGSEGMNIAAMLERGSLMSNQGMFAFKKYVQESSALRASIMTDIRVAAVEGSQALLKYEIDYETAAAFAEEAITMVNLLEKVKAGKGTEKERDAAVQAVFGREKDEEGKETPYSEEVKKFIADLRDPESKLKTGDRKTLLAEYYQAIKREPTEEEKEAIEKAKTEAGATWQSYVSEVSGKKGTWFAGVAGSLNVIAGIMGTMAGTLGLVLAAVIGGGLVAGLIPGGGLIKRGAQAVAGFAGKGFKAAGTGLLAARAGIGKGFKAAGEGLKAARGGVATAARGRFGGIASRIGIRGAAKVLGPIGVLTTQALAWKRGMDNAAEIMGKAEDAIGPLERVAAGAAEAVSDLTFGIVDSSKLARGETALHRSQYARSFGRLEADFAKLAKLTGRETIAGFGDVNVSEEEQMKKQFEHAQKMGWAKAGETLENYKKRISKPVQYRAQERQAIKDAQIATPKTGSSDPARAAIAGIPAGAGGAAKATGSISQGNLILEVSNWEDVLAESLHDLAANAG